MADQPKNIVYLRPDTIGDLVIFSSALAQLQAAWPNARHTLVVRPGYDDLKELFPAGIHWLVARLNPFRQKPSECRAELAALFAELEKLSPDLILAPTHNRTWLEAAVAAHFPQARRVALGGNDVDPIFATALRLDLGVEVARAFDEVVPSDENERDWENQHRFVDALLGRKTPRSRPSVRVSDAARAKARALLDGKKLPTQGWVAVFAGGLANVPIKAWQPGHFGELVRTLQRDLKLPVLLMGHVSEAAFIDSVATAAVAAGAEKPATWLGRDGEISLLAAMLADAKFYVGHDTGAMHLAAATGRPVVGIFGGGHWPRFRPVGPQTVSVVHPLPCFGCNWVCQFGDAPCVKLIEPADVRQAIDALLAAGAAPIDKIVEVAHLPAVTLKFIAASTPHFRASRRDQLERQHKIEELKRETDSKDGEISDLKKAAEARKTEMESIKAELEAECATKDTEIAELKSETDTKDEEIAGLKKAAEARKTEMEAIKAELEAECATKDEEIASLKGEANTKDSEIDALKKTCDEREQAIFRLDGHVKEFQRIVGVLNQAHAEKDALIKNQAGQIAAFTAGAAAAEKTVNDAKTELEQLRATLAKAEGVRASLPKDAAHYADAIHAKEVHIKNIEALVWLRDREIESLKATIATKEQSIANYVAGHGNLEQAGHYGRLLAEKEAVIQMLNKACVEREKVIQQLVSETTSSTAEVRRVWIAITAHVRLKWWEPLDRKLFHRVVEKYWMQIGILRHYEPRPLKWDPKMPRPRLPEAKLPRIGIVTPSYGQERFIEGTMLSVLNQNYPNLLYVVQDGGSKDASPQIIARYANRLRHWESARDRGQADAVRKGFAKIESELGDNDIMAWLNSDDFFAPGALRAVAEYFARHPDVDVVYGHRIIIDDNDRDVGRWIMPRHHPKTLEWIDYIPQETMFWRKRAWDLAGGIDPSFQFALDWDLLARFTLAGCRIERLPYFLGCFRVHPEQKTSQAIHTVGAEEMRRIRNRFHGERENDFETINAHARRTRFRGALVARLMGLGIRW